MSLRMVAGETPRLWRSTSALDPTGSSVDTKSCTMARSTASFRSSSTAAHLRSGTRECGVPVYDRPRANAPNERRHAYGAHMRSKQYGPDVLAPGWQKLRSLPEVPAEADLVV